MYLTVCTRVIPPEAELTDTYVIPNTTVFRFLFSILSLLPGLALAQGLPAGQWRYHSYFGKDSMLALSPSKVYTSYGKTIMTYDRATGELDNLNKITGLSEVNVTAMAHAYTRDLLVVGYRSGTIDLVEGNRITPLDGLSRADLSVSKAIQAIDIIGSRAYVSGAFGFLVVDLDKREIRYSNTALDPSGNNRPIGVRSICQSDAGMLYLATSQGVAYISASANLQDSRLYKMYLPGPKTGLPTGGGNLVSVASSGGNVYAAYDAGGVFVLQDTIWAGIPGLLERPVRSLKTRGSYLLASIGGSVYRIQGNGFSLSAQRDTTLGAPQAALQDTDDDIWVADLGRGLIHIKGGQTESYQTSSPGFQDIFRLYGYKDKMVALPGGYVPGVMFQNNNPNGIGIFSENFWKPIRQGHGLPANVTDISGAGYDPFNKELYLATYGNGLVVLPDDNTKPAYLINDSTRYRDGNNLVNALRGDPNFVGKFVRTQDVTIDRNGNLWALNWADTALHIRDLDRKWFGFVPPYPNRASAAQIFLDDQFIKYIRMEAPNGANSFMFLSPDLKKWASLTTATGKGGLVNNTVYDAAIDKDGALWLCTGQGMAVLYNPAQVFDPSANYNVTLPIFDGRPLLENDACKAIILDGGNRKWVGTGASGLWLFDKDVTKVLAHYTAENSPLPSNNILDLAVIPATGELFVSTEDGLISLNTAATDASLEEATNSCVRIFPNPVRPGYTGNIAIECLPENAVVKITDAGGRLVYEGKAAGGGIIWNGRDYQGRKPSPGIYLVYAYSDVQSAKVVGRFAMME